MHERMARRAVLDLEPYAWEASSAAIAQRHGLRVADVLRFDLNTSPFLPGAWAASLDRAGVETRPNEYFDTAYAELAAAIVWYLGVASEQLVIGAGADEVLDVIAKTFLDNGDAAVIAAPTYSMYAIAARLMGAEVRAVALGPDFAPDIEGLLAAAAGAKLLFHCNPNSPTGNLTAPDEFERLLANAPCMVVVDEAYAEYSGWSAIPFLERYPNLIVVRTLSKAFAMAGLRLGFGVARPEVAALLNRVRPPNSVSALTSRIGAAALRAPEIMRQQVAAIGAARAPFAAGLAAAGARVYPSVTNFLLTDWGEPARARAAYERLERRGLVVRNFADHPLIPGHLRVTVRTPEQNARLLDALRD